MERADAREDVVAAEIGVSVDGADAHASFLGAVDGFAELGAWEKEGRRDGDGDASRGSRRHLERVSSTVCKRAEDDP